MDWLVIDEHYLNYLRKSEKRIPRSNYGDDKYKPFLVFCLRQMSFTMSHKSHIHKNDILK